MFTAIINCKKKITKKKLIYILAKRNANFSSFIHSHTSLITFPFPYKKNAPCNYLLSITLNSFCEYG